MTGHARTCVPSRRWLSRATVLFALAAAACNQSLFASHSGDDADAGPGDGDDDGAEDGADDGPGGDAAPVSSCPAPCLGDAVAEFGDAQGGSNGRWSYLADLGAASGADYGELSFSEWNGLAAWTSGQDAVAIASCRDQSASACAGLPDWLLLVPDASGAERPALSFRAPETRGIRLSGAVRVADGEAVDVPVDLIVSRAGRHDAILASRIRTSTEARAIDAVIPALEGDEIVVSVGPSASAPPIALRLYFSGVDDGAGAFPGTCQMAARFDPDAPLVEACRRVDIADPNEEVVPPGPTGPGPGPSERLGEARIFAQEQYLVVGSSPLDYGADFTVQFWSRVEEPLLSFRVVQFSDYDADQGGNMFMLDGEQARFCYPTAQFELNCLAGPRPTDAAWHFWRVTRSTADATLRFCIDGAEVAQTPLDADRNLTGFAQPLLGKYAFESAEYAGALDEVRVFAEALPCATN
jgi:hypothetical protein